MLLDFSSYQKCQTPQILFYVGKLALGLTVRGVTCARIWCVGGVAFPRNSDSTSRGETI